MLGKRIQHAHLARVHDVIRDAPWLGTVMEFVDGEQLSDRVTSTGCPLEEVVAILTPLASAVDHLYENGIIHRDIKPDNIKLRADGLPALRPTVTPSEWWPGHQEAGHCAPNRGVSCGGC